MRAPALTEIVFCASHPGVNAYIRELTFLAIHGTVDVSVTRLLPLVPEQIAWDKVVADRAGLRREYRGPSKPVRAVSPACPYCGHALIHECEACGLLFCSGEASAQPCAGCGHVGPSVPLDDPAAPPHVMPGRPDWRERIVDFMNDIADRLER